MYRVSYLEGCDSDRLAKKTVCKNIVYINGILILLSIASFSDLFELLKKKTSAPFWSDRELIKSENNKNIERLLYQASGRQLKHKVM